METRRTPWHLWVIAIVSLLWNAMGAFDYTMTMTRNATYMDHFTKEQLDFFYNFPTWAIGAWAIAVWASVLASLLLLFRSSLAVPLFAVSFVAMVIVTFQNIVLHEPSAIAVMGTEGLIFSVVIFLVAAFLVWYAARMRTKAVLR